MDHLNWIIIRDVQKDVHLINTKTNQAIAIGVINHVCNAQDLHNFNAYFVVQDLIYIEIFVITTHVQGLLMQLIMIVEYVSIVNGDAKYVHRHLIVLCVQVVFIYMKVGVIYNVPKILSHILTCLLLLIDVEIVHKNGPIVQNVHQLNVRDVMEIILFILLIRHVLLHVHLAISHP